MLSRKKSFHLNLQLKHWKTFFLLKLVKPKQDSDLMRLLIQKSATYRQNEAIQPFPGITEFQPPLLYTTCMIIPFQMCKLFFTLHITHYTLVSHCVFLTNYKSVLYQFNIILLLKYKLLFYIFYFCQLTPYFGRLEFPPLQIRPTLLYNVQVQLHPSLEKSCIPYIIPFPRQHFFHFVLLSFSARNECFFVATSPDNIFIVIEK